MYQTELNKDFKTSKQRLKDCQGPERYYAWTYYVRTTNRCTSNLTASSPVQWINMTQTAHLSMSEWGARSSNMEVGCMCLEATAPCNESTWHKMAIFQPVNDGFLHICVGVHFPNFRVSCMSRWFWPSGSPGFPYTQIHGLAEVVKPCNC